MEVGDIAINVKILQIVNVPRNNINVMAISSNTGYGIHKLKTLLMKKQLGEMKYIKKTKINR